MIVVTAPAGKIGSQVLAGVLEASAPVRVIVRDAGKLPNSVRDRIEVIEGSHGDPVVVERAFAGADSVFWLAPPSPRATTVEEAYVGFTRPAAEALKRHRVKRVVAISALGRGTPWASKAGFVTASLAMDDLIASTGVAFRAVVNPSFMDNIARQAVPIGEQGVFFLPLDGDRKMPACATRDIAATVTRLLLDRSWSGTGQAAVLGPEDLSLNDMAAIMTEVLGKPIRYEQVSLQEYNAEVRTAENTTPTSFRQWCEQELKPIVRA